MTENVEHNDVVLIFITTLIRVQCGIDSTTCIMHSLNGCVHMYTHSHFSLFIHVQYVQQDNPNKSLVWYRLYYMHNALLDKPLITSCYTYGKQWFFDVRLRLSINILAYECATTISQLLSVGACASYSQLLGLFSNGTVRSSILQQRVSVLQKPFLLFVFVFLVYDISILSAAFSPIFLPRRNLLEIILNNWMIDRQHCYYCIITSITSYLLLLLLLLLRVSQLVVIIILLFFVVVCCQFITTERRVHSGPRTVAVPQHHTYFGQLVACLDKVTTVGSETNEPTANLILPICFGLAALKNL